MKTIEYKEVQLFNKINIEELDDLGKEGWELCGVVSNLLFTYYFKREKTKTKNKGKRGRDTRRPDPPSVREALSSAAAQPGARHSCFFLRLEAYACGIKGKKNPSHKDWG